ncbi:MAG: F0F1 ATP synthase subunit B [Oligoflexia bacterium]|nr:F0F1 ATP synthase subunit B [Oligoflexia bacterium]
MLIDWFTVIAQALNFLILVWLMKRFLYQPILHAIDEREKKIATALANADQKKAEAQKESDEFKHKNEEFDRQREVLLSKATEEVQAQRKRLLDEAQSAATALTLKRQETLKKDEANLHQSIVRRTQQEVFAIARKALTDLAESSLEERMVNVLIRRLHDTRLALTAGPMIIRTCFDLPAAQKNAIKDILGTEIEAHFETAPDLISGIELIANGQKVAWSISDYLSLLKKGVNQDGTGIGIGIES